MTIAVRAHTYTIHGFETDDGAFADYLSKLRAAADQQRDNIPVLFLTSAADTDCGRFTAAARLISERYVCKSGDNCMWGYGRGERVEPVYLSWHPDQSNVSGVR